MQQILKLIDKRIEHHHKKIGAYSGTQIAEKAYTRLLECKWLKREIEAMEKPNDK